MSGFGIIEPSLDDVLADIDAEDRLKAGRRPNMAEFFKSLHVEGRTVHQHLRDLMYEQSQEKRPVPWDEEADPAKLVEKMHRQ
jgi:hypothetical protein